MVSPFRTKCASITSIIFRASIWKSAKVQSAGKPCATTFNSLISRTQFFFSSLHHLHLNLHWHFFRWDKQPTSPSNGVSDNYHAIEWTRLRAETLRDYYSMAPISMQCNQSSGERFPGNWEGLASPGLPLPLPDTRNNVKPCESRDDTQDEYVPD